MPIYKYKIYTANDVATEMTFEDYFEVGEAPKKIDFNDGTYAKKYVQPFGLQKFSSSFDTEFPYFDRGLGREITSASHRHEVDFSDEMAEYQKKVREEDAIVADMQDRLEHHPGYADYRRQRDRGWTPKRVIKNRGTINYKGESP